MLQGHRLGAQRLVVEVEWLDGGHQLVERAAPFRLEPLTDRRATPGELGEPELRVMQSLTVVMGRGAGGIEFMLRVRHAVVRVGHGALGGFQARFGGCQLGNLRFQVGLPGVHPGGEGAVGLLDLRQFRRQRGEAVRGGIAFLAQPLPAVAGDLQPRLRLGQRDLRVGAAVPGGIHAGLR